MTKPFQTDSFQSLLETEWVGRSDFQVFDTIDSTNEEAKRMLRHAVPTGQVLLAETQTQGRGTHGRVWHSPVGTDLYLSILLKPSVPLSEISLLTLSLGMAVVETVEHFVDSHDVRVKWPNDVWIAGKKCAGILVETHSDDEHLKAAIVGVGLNVNRLEWSPEIQDISTSLLQSMRQEEVNSFELSREKVLALLLQRIEYWVDQLSAKNKSEMLNALRSRLALKDEWVQCDDISGTLLGVDDEGALLIESATQVHRVISGRLSIVLKD